MDQGHRLRPERLRTLDKRQALIRGDRQALGQQLPGAPTRRVTTRRSERLAFAPGLQHPWVNSVGGLF